MSQVKVSKRDKRIILDHLMIIIVNQAKSNGNHCLIEEYEDVFDDEDEDCEIELVVQGRTIAVSENLLCKHSLYFKYNVE